MPLRPFALLGAVCLTISFTTPAFSAPAAPREGLSIFWSFPFVLLLSAIALMPFILRHWWERHYPKVSVGLALGMAAYYFARGAPLVWLHEMKEYLSFIILLGSLFLVSGGIAIRINRRATPLANTTLLLIGAILANLFGTTGAAMLLIRPYMRMNRNHIKPYHIVFFIFIVANTGGSLTPIGDPPLFLGYLKGIPFFWVFEHMKYPALLTVGLLLAIFFIFDVRDQRGAARDRVRDAGPQVHLLGAHNFIFIGAIIAAVFRPGFFDLAAEMAGNGFSLARILELLVSREFIMVAAAGASTFLTPRPIYQSNEFSFGPIKEVAILFLGIFSTMVPALEWVEHNAGKMDLTTPGQYYFASGLLSSGLDNAPTYVTLFKTCAAKVDPKKVDEVQEYLKTLAHSQSIHFDTQSFESDESRGAVGAMIKYHEEDIRRGAVTREQVQVAFLLGLPSWSMFIVAISAGSVFWGACTYIGNGPNFMVKSIADSAGVKTPSFLQYIYKFTLPILIPIYLVVWLVFFYTH